MIELGLWGRVGASRCGVPELHMIDVRLVQRDPILIVVVFAGIVTVDETVRSREFGDIIKGLDGEPFRVLCDFTRASTMPDAVSEMFLKAQSFAVARGMERDAFVSSSAMLRLQFNRVARQSGRFASLGELRFFDDMDSARAYILA